MKITDEMVDKAWAAYERNECSMRAALEAALGAQVKTNAGDLVDRLRNQSPALGLSESGVPRPITERAAACIEDLAAVLKSCESWIDRWTSHVGHCDGVVKCTCGRAAMLYEASATLEKWGLK